MNLKQAIRRAAETPGLEPYSLIGRVVSVDASARVVEVEPINGSANVEASLQATTTLNSGFLILPAEGSFVVVTFLGPANAFVVGSSDFQVIELGGSANGNVPIISKMRDEIQKLTDRINLIESALNASPVFPGDGGAVYKAAIAAALSAVPFLPPNFTDESVGNEKLKH